MLILGFSPDCCFSFLKRAASLNASCLALIEVEIPPALSLDLGEPGPGEVGLAVSTLASCFPATLATGTTLTSGEDGTSPSGSTFS